MRVADSRVDPLVNNRGGDELETNSRSRVGADLPHLVFVLQVNPLQAFLRLPDSTSECGQNPLRVLATIHLDLDDPLLLERDRVEFLPSSIRRDPCRSLKLLLEGLLVRG